MPLTLVTGFFGMNTGGLMWTDDPSGTYKVTLTVCNGKLLCSQKSIEITVDKQSQSTTTSGMGEVIDTGNNSISGGDIVP